MVVTSILLVFLFIAPWFYGLTRFRDQLVAQCLLFSFFLLVLPFLNRKPGSTRLGTNPFDGWVFLGLGIGFFYIFFSSLPYQSVLAFLRLLSCAVFYVLIRSIVRTDKTFQVFLWAILVLGLFYSVYGLLQYYGFLSSSYWHMPRCISSRYVNGGHFAVLLLFPLFIGIALLASSRKIIAQVALIFFLLIMGWAFLLSLSRAPWIAFVVGLGIFVLLARKNRFLSGRSFWGVTVLAGMGFLLFFLQGGLGLTGARFGQLWNLRFYSLVNRWQFWETALSAIRERPWGWGLGTLSSILPQYRLQADRFFIDYAHNEFLQVAVDLGVPGVLLLAGFILFYLQKAWFFLRRREITDFQKAVGTGFLALWVGLVLVSQVDFPLRIYATGILFATFLGLSAYLFGPSETGTSRKKGFFWVIPWGLVFFSSLVTARQLFAEFHFQEGKRLEQGFSWKEALTEYEKAVRLSPFFAGYRESLGYLYEQRAKIVLDPNQRKSLRQKAIRAYQEAGHLDPYRAVTHYLLASLYEEEGEVLRAQAEFLRAISLAPKNALFDSEYGYFAFRHSFVEEGIEAFERVKRLPFYGEAKTDLDEILKLSYRVTQDYDQLRRVVPESLAGDNRLARFLAENGRWDLARKGFEALTERSKKTYPDYAQYFEMVGRQTAEFYLSHDRPQEALEIYQEAARMLPYNGEVKRKVGELHEHLSRV